MNFNSDIMNNTVNAENQVNDKVKMVCPNDGNALKVLFLGNSITRHAIKLDLGWTRDCGMAASKPENDYVHLVTKYLIEKHGKLDYCVTNVGRFELYYKTGWNSEDFKPARDFHPDIIIVRLGENVRTAELDEKKFKEEFIRFIDYFKTEKSRVIVTDLFWDYPPIAKIIKNACNEKGCTFVSIADLGYNNENKAIGEFENYAVSIHPNDLGMKRIAERIIEKL